MNFKEIEMTTFTTFFAPEHTPAATWHAPEFACAFLIVTKCSD
jgi:hypothetical protein